MGETAKTGAVERMTKMRTMENGSCSSPRPPLLSLSVAFHNLRASGTKVTDIKKSKQDPGLFVSNLSIMTFA